jgi:dTMP kinase
MSMRTNTLIVFEGIDGSGKATQAKLLTARLKKQGHQVTQIRSPRYQKPIGKLIKAALRGAHGDFLALSPYFSGLPYLLDFATMKDSLVASLKIGIVVADRYVPSTLAFHGAKLDGSARHTFIAFVRTLMYKEAGLPKPHLVIYLKVPPALAKDHMDSAGKDLDQFESDRGYQTRVAATYATLAKDRSWRTVECKEGESPRVIHERVWDVISAS